jgi:hypothetical protein
MSVREDMPDSRRNEPDVVTSTGPTIRKFVLEFFVQSFVKELEKPALLVDLKEASNSILRSKLAKAILKVVQFATGYAQELLKRGMSDENLKQRIVTLNGGLRIALQCDALKRFCHLNSIRKPCDIPSRSVESHCGRFVSGREQSHE